MNTILGVPMWLFVSCMVASLAAGVGIRRYMNAKKKRAALAEQALVKDMKKQAKMQRRRAKKAEKAKKNRKGPREDADAAS